MKRKEEFSFEKENIKKRKQKESNVIKRYNIAERSFQVGTLDTLDPYSGTPIYAPVEESVAEEAFEVDEMGYDLDRMEPVSDSQNATETQGTEDSVFDSSQMSSEELDLANEIYQRLMNEAAADERAKQEEIEALKREQEATSADYNAETGSYSGLYGKKPMNDAEAEALASIMNTNSSFTKSIEDLIKENQG